MENKEALEYLKNHNKYYEPVNREAFRVIEKDLQELEELKKIMGTPIQDIMKRLKILERINLLVARYNDGVLGCVDFVFEVKEVLNNDK